jgi:hypothetical protein
MHSRDMEDRSRGAARASQGTGWTAIARCIAQVGQFFDEILEPCAMREKTSWFA